jgi:predicted esterase
MRLRSFVASGLLLPLIGLVLPGQTNRLELGLRVRAVERQLESCASREERLRVAPHLEAAVQRFFSGSEGAVAEALAEASACLRGAELSDAERFAASLAVDLDARLVDAKTPFVTGAVRQFFPCRAAGNGEVTVRIRWAGSAAEAAVLPMKVLPTTFQIPLAAPAAGEQLLEWQVCQGAEVLASRQLRVSVADSPSDRTKALADQLAAASDLETVEHKTLGLLLEMLRSLGPNGEQETELPGLELLEEAESLAAALQARQPASRLLEPGQHWVRIPLGKRSATLRLGLPPRKDADERLPLVILLHGAGGSENMFFDLYGCGAVVQSCLERGWIVVAPRSGVLAKPPLEALVVALAARWPIDPARVAVVGHSMGGMQALAAVQSNPERFVGAGILGAGGSPRRGTELEVPFFVGIGDRDFAHDGALGLVRKLRATGAPVTLQEYPGVEHLAIAQFARADLMLFLEGVLAPR